MCIKMVKFQRFCHFCLQIDPLSEIGFQIVQTFRFYNKQNVFVGTGFSIVAACGRCWVASRAIASAR